MMHSKKKKMMGHGGPNMKKKMDGMMDKMMMMYGGSMKKKMKKGGMMKVDAAKNPGLSKLPKKVRNKMGYMKDGGKAKAKKMMYGGNVGHSGGSKAAGDVTQVYSSSGNYKVGQ